MSKRSFSEAIGSRHSVPTVAYCICWEMACRSVSSSFFFPQAKGNFFGLYGTKCHQDRTWRTHKIKTQQLSRSNFQRCGEIELEKRYVNSVLIIIIVNRPSSLFLSCLLLLGPLAASTLNVFYFYFCRLIGKLDAFRVKLMP